MIAGLLNDWVTLLRPEVSTDGFGAETTSYESYGRVRAEVRWKSGTLSPELAELFPDVHLEVVVREAHPAAAKWRVVHEGEIYTVEAVERNRLKGLRRLICSKANI